MAQLRAVAHALAQARAPGSHLRALIASLAGRCEDDVTVILARIPASLAG